MSVDFLNRLETLDYLISIKSTGSPEQLANKLRISRRSVYEYINLLKQLDAPIAFSRDRNTFYYTEDGNFKFRFYKVKK
jgi:predicted DNA-binding transcriptional regulator YafY